MTKKNEAPKVFERRLLGDGFRNALKRHSCVQDYSVSPNKSFMQHVLHNENPVASKAGTIALPTRQALPAGKRTPFRTDSSKANVVFLPCLHVVAGPIQVMDVKSRFDKTGFRFMCPDVPLVRLYSLCFRTSEIDLMEYYIDHSTNVIFFSLKFDVWKLAELLSLPKDDGCVESLQFVTLVVKEEGRALVEDVIKMFPLLKRRNISLEEAQARKDKLTGMFVATPEELRNLRRKRAPSLIFSGGMTLGFDDPYPQGYKDVARLGRSNEYLDPKKKGSSRKLSWEQKTDKPAHEVGQSKLVVDSGRKVSSPLTDAAPPEVFVGETKYDSSVGERAAELESSRSVGETKSPTALCFWNQRERSKPISYSKSYVQLPRSPTKLPAGLDREQDREEAREEGDDYYVVYPPPPATNGLVVFARDMNCLRPGEWLNDSVIDFYFSYSYDTKCSDKEKQRLHVFSSFFCTILGQLSKETDGPQSEEDKYERASRWTRHVDIFGKDFLVFPINHHHHWFMAAACFLGEADRAAAAQLAEDEDGTVNERSEEIPSLASVLKKRPCILVFDSLAGQRHAPIDKLKEFFGLEFEHRKGKRICFDSKSLPTVYLDVPQQDNCDDCGVFVLQFFDSFCESLLKDFEVPLASFKTWFQKQQIKGKRGQIGSVLESIHGEQQSRGQLRPDLDSLLGPYRQVFQP